MTTPDDTPIAPPVAKKATARKRTRKPAAKKGAVQAVARKPVRKAGTATQPPKASKPQKKPKLVRDSYTMPKDEHAVLGELKQRGAKLGQAIKKSELLRAGLKALAAMGDKALLAALKAVPSIKTGRPKKT
jgi:hypothetical protein